jgi:FMN-dependent dehydrogenase
MTSPDPRRRGADTGASCEVAESALTHKLAQVEAAYNRGDLGRERLPMLYRQLERYERKAAGMNVAGAVNIDDLRRLARRRLPRILFDWIDGGAGDETALRQSMAGFAATRFLPRYLANISSCDLTKSLFGRTYALPLGLARLAMSDCSGQVASWRWPRRRGRTTFLSFSPTAQWRRSKRRRKLRRNILGFSCTRPAIPA